jgi:Zn-finger nucleic acid-binding protein
MLAQPASATVSSIAAGTKERFAHSFKRSRFNGEFLMQCPACPDQTLAMTNREGIEIDYCPKCRGVWLDRGELDKIIERSAAQTVRGPEVRGSADPRRPPGEYRDYDDDDDYYRRHGKRRRGMLGDLFDFD